MKKIITLFSMFIMLSSFLGTANAQLLAPQSLTYKQTSKSSLLLNWEYPNSNIAYPINPLEEWTPYKYWELDASRTGVFSDGYYMYLIQGKNFLKHDMEGNYLETVVVEGLPDILQVTTDGKYFYAIADGGMSGKYGIYKFDINTKEILDIIPTSVVLLHITYVPELDGGKGGFEAGNPDAGYYFSMKGEYLGDAPTFNTAVNGAVRTVTYYDGKLYAFHQTKGTFKVIIELDIETNKPTGNRFDLTDLAGYYGFTESQMAIALNIYEDRKAGTMNAAAITYWTTDATAGYRIALFKLGERPKLTDLQAYNIYRNNNKINTNVIPSSDSSYEDTNLEEGIEYTYSMTAVYNGSESPKSDEITVTLPYTNQLPLAEDFNSGSFDQESWSIFTNGLQTAWVITNTSTITALEDYLPCLTYTYRFNADYNQTFTSKPLKINNDETTLLRFDAYCSAKQSNEQLNIEIFRNGEWKTVQTINSWTATAWEHQEIDLSDELDGFDGNFQVRFRFSGASFSPHNWYFDNIRIWCPGYLEFGGNVYQTSNPLPNAILSLEKIDDSLISYQITSDEEGAFYLPKVEKGYYKFTITHNGDVLLSDENYFIDSSDKNIEINIIGAIIEMDNTPHNIVMGENKTMKVKAPIHNAGNAALNWNADLVFNTVGTGNEVGENNIHGKPAWQMISSFELKSNNEKALTYHQGYFYTLSLPNTINKYSLEGEYISSTPFSSSHSSASLVSDGNKIYQVTYSNGLIPIDLDNGTVVNDEKIVVGDITLDRIWYATYDPVNDLFYAGNEHYMKKVDRNGNSEEFTINLMQGSGNSTYAFAMTMDTFSEGGPYLWIISSKDSPVGTLSGTSSIFQYSIPERDILSDFKAIDDLPNYAGTATPNGLTMSTAIMPGYMTLSGIATYNSKAVVFTYKMVPFENWLSLEKSEGVLYENDTENFNIGLNSSMLKESDSRNAKVVITSNSASSSLIEIPVSLSIDNSMEERCLSPINLSGERTDDYKVSLRWEMPEGAESIQGYNVYRNGEPLNVDLITEKAFIDEKYNLGKQSYTVQAVYSFGCESLESESFELIVENPNIIIPVDNAVAKVVNGKHVKISWDESHLKNEIFDNFESYAPFIISDMGDWTLFDGDKAWTYYDSNIYYNNRGTRMAYMVFNPSTAGSSVFTHDGSQQLLVAFANNIYGLRDDNWIISPELNFDRTFSFSFMAKAHSNTYNEEINVAYSLTGNNPEDFIMLNGDKTISLPTFWTEHSYTIPAEAKYVAINHVTLDGFMALFDDLFIGHPEYYTKILGYNVYRDDVKLNKKYLTTPEFGEYNLEDGEYTYTVEAVFDNGVSSKVKTNTVTVNYSHNVTAPRDLEGEIEGKEVVLSWNPPAWESEFDLRYDDGTPNVEYSVGGFDTETLIAIRFDANEINVYEGYSITGVKFYIADKVNYVYPFIFVDGEHMKLGEELKVNPNQYITYYFPTPVTIEANKEYIIGYSFETASKNFYPATHDFNKGTPGKSDLVSNDGGFNWYSMYQLQGAEWDINWNIAALLELHGEVGKVAHNYSEQDDRWSEAKETKMPILTKDNREHDYVPSQTTAFTDFLNGYNVYRDGKIINETPLKTLTFTDSSVDLQVKDIEYYVTAVYAESGEKASETITLNKSSIDNISSEINVYPNPVTDKLHIKGLFDFVSLTSLDGKLVYQNNKADGMTTVDVQNFAPGVYLLTVKAGANTEHHKIIIK